MEGNIFDKDHPGISEVTVYGDRGYQSTVIKNDSGGIIASINKREIKDGYKTNYLYDYLIKYKEPIKNPNREITESEGSAQNLAWVLRQLKWQIYWDYPHKVKKIWVEVVASHTYLKEMGLELGHQLEIEVFPKDSGVGVRYKVPVNNEYYGESLIKSCFGTVPLTRVFNKINKQ